MTIKVLAFMPLFTCLFWLVLNPFVHKKDRSFKLLQLLLTSIGVSTLAEAEITFGGDTEQLIFYFIRQFFTVIVIPVAVIYIQSVGQSSKRTFTLTWASIPATMILAQIALLLTYGREPFLQCISSHTNILTLGKEHNAVEFLIHLCSFWLFYGILTVEFIMFGIFTILSKSPGETSLQHKSLSALITIYAAIEAMQLSMTAERTWLSAVMLIIFSASIYFMAFSTFLYGRTDISFREIAALSFKLVPEDHDQGSIITAKSLKKMAQSVSVAPQQESPDENYLKARFEELIISNRLYLKKGIRVSDVAKILRTNRTYISKLVNDTYGMSFSDYINILRIKFAQEYLIEHPDAKQSEMAVTCGFPDASAFNNAFKKVTGMTPKIWLVTNP